MTKKNLIIISGITDSIDAFLLGGLLPPPLSILLDVPALIAHYLNAGPKAVWVLLELVPGVSFAPIYTAAAMAYPDKDKNLSATSRSPIRPWASKVTVSPAAAREETIIDAEIVPPPTAKSQARLSN